MLAQPSGEMFTGIILKRSEWLREWRERVVRVEPAVDTFVLSWRGGKYPGRVAIDTACRVQLNGIELVVFAGGRELHFRAAVGGPTLDQWKAAIEMATPEQLQNQLQASYRQEEALARDRQGSPNLVAEVPVAAIILWRDPQALHPGTALGWIFHRYHSFPFVVG